MRLEALQFGGPEAIVQLTCSVFCLPDFGGVRDSNWVLIDCAAQTGYFPGDYLHNKPDSGYLSPPNNRSQPCQDQRKHGVKK